MKRLDALDFKILELLKERGAVSPNATYIAKKLKKPIATVHGRLRRLEGRGVVQKYAPMINPKEIGSEIMSFVFFKIPAGQSVEDFLKKLEKSEGVTEINFVVGEWSFICKVRAKNMDDYTRVINKIFEDIKPSQMEDIISPKSFRKEV